MAAASDALRGTGKDPQRSHAYPPSRAGGGSGATDPATVDQTVSAPDPPLSRKRSADDEFDPIGKAQKAHYESTPGGGSSRIVERKPRKTQTGETKGQKDASLQVGRYLLEQFSVPAFRSHATIGLVDRERIQFYHANHSTILVTSAINFSPNDPGGSDKFIAIVIAFSRLSLGDSGIFHNLQDGGLFRDNGDLPTSKPEWGAVRIQEGKKLEFGGDENTEPFTVTYGEVISHEPSLAGRATTVLHATSPRWDDIDLVVKISWPGSERVSEHAFLDEAIKKAKSTAKNEWALEHLPGVLFAQDVIFDSDSTHEKVARLFDNAEFVDGVYKYERRTLRIIIQERLYPLKTLTEVKDIAQVLVDIACGMWISVVPWLPYAHAGIVHRWLYEVAGILHRDLSMSNIMYRIIKGKVYGVLTDYDLSSWVASLNSDYTKTSQQRTGTPPFMAHELLDGSEALHVYRHDVESLFYIMLIMATHYDVWAPTKEKDGGVRIRSGKLPFERWFGQLSYEDLSSSKQTSISNLGHLDLSPSFRDFRGWLLKLQGSLFCGFEAKRRQQFLMEGWTEEPTNKGAPPTFDHETLGGHVDYSALINPVRHLKGEIEGLVIRYEPPAPTSAVRSSWFQWIPPPFRLPFFST